MLNPKKIRLETKAAILARNEEREAIRINQYMKQDYISFHMIQNAVTFTIAYAVVIGWYILYQAQLLEDAVNLSQFQGIVLNMATIYVILLVLFELLSFVYFWKRYDRAHKTSRAYGKLLKKLQGIQTEEHKEGESRA